jgi:glycosyltransferase involved in cell wall biosynthesis
MKKRKKIWGNCLVRNEENWIWYALMSVIDYLDKILVWDTGSTDKTVQIIKSIKTPKISFKQYGPVTPETFVKPRQEMLEATKADWLFLIDGDEIWPEESIKTVVEAINKKGDKIESIVLGTINFVGDVYHYQEEEAGEYQILDKKGHYNLRAMNMKIPGLHADLPHGQQGYFDEDNKPIQKRDPKKILFLPVHYFHATHLPRSSKDDEVPMRQKKRKYEIGLPLLKEIEYPEVFYLKRPEIIPDPWVKMSKEDYLRASLQTPFKRIKRKLSLK